MDVHAVRLILIVPWYSHSQIDPTGWPDTIPHSQIDPTGWPDNIPPQSDWPYWVAWYYTPTVRLTLLGGPILYPHSQIDPTGWPDTIPPQSDWPYWVAWYYTPTVRWITLTLTLIEPWYFHSQIDPITRTSEWVITLWRSCELFLRRDISRVRRTSEISLPKTMNILLGGLIPYPTVRLTLPGDLILYPHNQMDPTRWPDTPSVMFCQLSRTLR